MKELLVSRLRHQVEQAVQNLPFYQELYGIDDGRPPRIESLSDFEELPFTHRSDLIRAFQANPPYGGFWRPDVVRVCLTPAPQLGTMPVLYTRNDLMWSAKHMAAMFRRMGVTPDDTVQISVGYSPFIAGTILQDAYEELGAKTFPAGPGHVEQQLAFMKQLGSTVLHANPSFALKLGEAGARFRVLVLGGEPFTSIEGYRDRFYDVYGAEAIVTDFYGLSEFLPVAGECKNLNGLHVDEDFVYAEVIDPETGQVLPPGERGELVLTHLKKEAMPLIRFRTGDLAVIERRTCSCGQSFTMPSGVIGRVDEMYKVKGVKFYPSQLPLLLASFSGIDPRAVRVELDKRGGTDYMALWVKGDQCQVDVDQMRERLKRGLLIAPNEIHIVSEVNEGVSVVDRRK